MLNGYTLFDFDSNTRNYVGNSFLEMFVVRYILRIAIEHNIFVCLSVNNKTLRQ